MRMIYISHPYTGREIPNRADAEHIAADLAKRFPGVAFFNPLNAMRHLKNTKLPYETILAQCVALMEKCDGVIMTGDWKKSYGCGKEREYAKAQNMIVWDSPAEFSEDEVMPNDCCGKYHCCGTCICQKCAERLVCWNCNDCTRPKGKQRAIGYTRMKDWEPECSRFIRQDKK